MTSFQKARPSPALFTVLMAASVLLAVACVLELANVLGMITIPRPLGDLGFLAYHVGWFVSVILLFVVFGKKAAWALLALPFVLLGPAFISLLSYQCAVNDACL